MDHAITAVLILEDQPFIAFDLEELLLESGFETIILMSSRAEAEEWLKNNRPDIAILDIHLNDGPCTEVAQALVDRGIPFVVHTGSDQRHLSENSIFLKGRWLSKPCEPEDLLGMLKELFG